MRKRPERRRRRPKLGGPSQCWLLEVLEYVYLQNVYISVIYRIFSEYAFYVNVRRAEIRILSETCIFANVHRTGTFAYGLHIIA